MTIYNTIKNATKTTALSGLAALVLALTPGCGSSISPELSSAFITAPTQKSAQNKPTTRAGNTATSRGPEPEVLPARTAGTAPKVNAEKPAAQNVRNIYAGIRYGQLTATGEKKTNYNGKSDVYGVEIGVEGANGLTARLVYDVFESSKKGTVNGTPYKVENDSNMSGADLIYRFRKDAKLSPNVGAGYRQVEENTRETVGWPYNENNSSSSKTNGVNFTAGLKYNGKNKKWYAGIEANHTILIDSDNAKGITSYGVSAGGKF